jgi:hypothetical protein
MSKSALIIGAFALASLNIASAKSYDFRIDNPTKVGSVELKPGEYHVKIEGSNAVFVPADTKKEITAPARIENSDRKFDQTMVMTRNENGVSSLKEIDLGGSNTKVEFGAE